MMKMLLKTFLFISSFFIFQSCASGKNNPDELNRQWMLVEFQNFSRDLMVKNNAQMDLSQTKSPKNLWKAKMGCNQMFFEADFKANGTVKFSDVGSTMMYCENSMKLEDAFVKALPLMTKYKIDGHHLTLTDAKGNQMKFVAADWD